MDSPSMHNIYALNRNILNLSTPAEQTSRTNIICCKPANVLKYFGHNITQLKDTSGYKIWKYCINSVITATGYTYLFTDKVKLKDIKVVHTIYVSIIDKIADQIMANFLYTGTLIKTLTISLEECFNLYTVMYKVYDKSLLFKCLNHVKNFGRMLNKLE